MAFGGQSTLPIPTAVVDGSPPKLVPNHTEKLAHRWLPFRWEALNRVQPEVVVVRSSKLKDRPS